MKQSNEDMARSHFAKDTERHVLTVFKDDGVYRHIRMAKPGDSNMRYDIVTWPGYLAYSGNMGDFTFSRVEDMFTFFRPENPGSVQPYINLSYWSEKITAADKNDGYRQYSGDMFEAAVKERLEEYYREMAGDRDDSFGHHPDPAPAYHHPGVVTSMGPVSEPPWIVIDTMDPKNIHFINSRIAAESYAEEMTAKTGRSYFLYEPMDCCRPVKSFHWDSRP